MFLPNTDSFVLIRRPIVKTGFPVFLPNTESFLLIRRSTVKPEFAPTPVLEETGVGAESDSGQSEELPESCGCGRCRHCRFPTLLA